MTKRQRIESWKRIVVHLRKAADIAEQGYRKCMGDEWGFADAGFTDEIDEIIKKAKDYLEESADPSWT